MRPYMLLFLVACLGGCSDGDQFGGAAAAGELEQDERVATVHATGSDRLSQDEIEANRMNMDWRQWVERDGDLAGDTLGAAPGRPAAVRQAPSLSEEWDEISPDAVNSGPIALPVSGDVGGPSVLRVQVLLSRALFSPGIIDGRWGRNTEKAVYWLQRREGMEPTGEVDERTWQALQQLSGQPQQLVRSHRLSEDDVAGPFVELPAEYYDRRDMDCQCFESLAEKLAERFHTSEDLLRQLNPGVDLNTVRAGSALHVPNVDDRRTPAGDVARIVVSDGGKYVHAMDGNGRVLYHFPATLGSAYSPSPSGEYRVTGIAHDPTWHYQPALLEGVDDDKPSAVLPPGPNNAVGVVWMQLSKPHYGIHGTSAPETIGYATSNGCVRLTNWDADFLSRRVRQGTPVEFRDVQS
jgi:lipoprotein-anchoring transpeptidase ErfK/SrfK